jgi:hypothetical protein
MRSSFTILAAAAAILLVAPQLAAAEDSVETQIQAMNDRMSQMEQQLQATQDQLDASKQTVERQQELIQKAGIERDAKSGLSAFLSQTQFSGFIASSFNYNWNNPDNTAIAFNKGLDGSTIFGANSGNLFLTAPGHSNPQTFQLDQFFLSMLKPATAESRGGWGVELMWGSMADFLGQPGQVNIENATGDFPHLYQAYVEYLADLGPGVDMKLGRFEGVIGAESAREDRNFNITHGLLWTLQPVNHTGIIASTKWENGIILQLAGVNDFGNTMANNDEEIGFLGELGWECDHGGIYLNGYHGGNSGTSPYSRIVFPNGGNGGIGSNDTVSLIDVVAKWKPSEKLSTWANFDYFWADGTHDPVANGANFLGFGLAGRYALTDRLGFAMRGEMVRGENTAWFLSPDGIDADNNRGANAWLWEVTATVDYALTDSLTVRGETRLDWCDAHSSPNDCFVAHSTPDFGPNSENIFTKDMQVLSLVQLLYRF